MLRCSRDGKLTPRLITGILIRGISDREDTRMPGDDEVWRLMIIQARKHQKLPMTNGSWERYEEILSQRSRTTLPTPLFWISGLQSFKRTNSFCFKPPDLEICYSNSGKHALCFKSSSLLLYIEGSIEGKALQKKKKKAPGYSSKSGKLRMQTIFFQKHYV